MSETEGKIGRQQVDLSKPVDRDALLERIARVRALAQESGTASTAEKPVAPPILSIFSGSGARRRRNS